MPCQTSGEKMNARQIEMRGGPTMNDRMMNQKQSKTSPYKGTNCVNE